MEPQEFIEFWGVEVAEVALLLDVERQSVYQWLTRGQSRKNPDPRLKKLLMLAHLRFLQWRLEDEQLPPHYREIYETIRDRGFPMPLAAMLGDSDPGDEASDDRPEASLEN